MKRRSSYETIISVILFHVRCIETTIFKCGSDCTVSRRDTNRMHFLYKLAIYVKYFLKEEQG